MSSYLTPISDLAVSSRDEAGLYLWDSGPGFEKTPMSVEGGG